MTAQNSKLGSCGKWGISFHSRAWFCEPEEKNSSFYKRNLTALKQAAVLQVEVSEEVYRAL
jgi:hypothetical protein